MSEDAEDCDFCAIIRGVRSARVVCETKHALAFFPLHPAALGHVLVVPKKHVPDFWAADDVTASHLGRALIEVAHGLKRALAPDGLNIIQSSGAAASQTVFHLHVHLVPRWFGDHIGALWPPSEPWSETVEDDVAGAVRRACSAEAETAVRTTTTTPTKQIRP